ncbi:hypothetical protein DFQ30_007959, partial [Apophysomyces sp. BC1015]
LETLLDWRVDDSDTTVYRRIATIFDYLFRSTPVKLADGETASNCTHNFRVYNHVVFNYSTSDRLLHGRKIDLLIWCGKNLKELELSSNEFKEASAVFSIALYQQNKR